MLIQRRIINYFLAIFTLPRVKTEIARYAKSFKNEASRYSSGIKGEAQETREAFVILTKFIKKEKISRAEKKRFKHQIAELLKGSGVVIPVMLIPLPFVSTLLLILMDHLLLSMNIRLLPDAFYPEKNSNLLTTDRIKKDLENEIYNRHKPIEEKPN